MDKVVRKPRNKLKNPETYIRGLQEEVSDLRRRIDLLKGTIKELEKLHGELIVDWIQHIKVDDVSDLSYMKLNPGDKIVILGNVKSVSGFKFETGNEKSSIEYTVLETRRVPQRF